jgi:hypothetical protein
MFKEPCESEAYTNHGQHKETNSTLSSVISVLLPALLAISYLPLVTLISLSDFEHVNPSKRNGFYCAVLRMVLLPQLAGSLKYVLYPSRNDLFS